MLALVELFVSTYGVAVEGCGAVFALGSVRWKRQYLYRCPQPEEGREMPREIAGIGGHF